MSADTVRNEKNALVLFGSPRKAGFTARLLTQYLAGLSGYRVRVIDAYEQAALPCTACGYCETHVACAINDLDEFYRLLEDADLLVIAVPVYNLGLPAPLKAMVDRMQVYWSRRFKQNIRPPITKPKQGVLLLTAGKQSGGGIDVVKNALLRVFTVLNVVDTDVQVLTGTDGMK